MGFEKVQFYGIVEIDCNAVAQAVFNLYTDQPAGVMALRETRTIAATSGRQVVRIRLAGTTKGKLLRPEIVPTGLFYLYGMRVWARVAGAAAPWQWYAIPVVETPEAWTAVKLPIEPTPDEWSAVKLPIPESGEEWTPVKLAVQPSSETAEWIDLPMDE